jgi:AraC family transcriptional regulator of adaptative response/methylated-DNA-[protein]-cysteine methyltransferase
MIAGATAEGVCLFEFPGRVSAEETAGGSPYLEQLRREINEYFDGSRTNFTVPLDVQGTPFQMKVWGLLRQIPYGETWSYEELAYRLGNPAAIRAVGTANGRNHIAILIPCHRVINKNGQLGGYGGELWRKARLLELEGAMPPACAQPALPFPEPAHS